MCYEENPGVDGALALIRSENFELKGTVEELGKILALQASKNSAMERKMKAISDVVLRKEFQDMQMSLNK